MASAASRAKPAPFCSRSMRMAESTKSSKLKKQEPKVMGTAKRIRFIKSSRRGAAARSSPAPLPLVQPVLPQLVAHQVQSPQPGADGHPGDGSHSRPGVVVIPADDKGGQAHADDHLGGGSMIWETAVGTMLLRPWK